MADEATLDLMSAYMILKRRYGIDITPDDFIEEAYLAFKEINSVPVKYYYYVTKPSDPDSMAIQLPCNLYRILSITSTPMNSDGFKDIEPYMEFRNNRDAKTQFYNILAGNSDLKTYHLNDTPYTGLGTYIKYEYIEGEDSTIQIMDKRLFDKEIHIVFEGIAVNKEGLPLITRKHAVAIAAKVALVFATRMSFKGNQAMVQMVPFLQQESARLAQAAAIPEHITDNELDEMLNEFSRYERKRYNRSFKFRRGQ